MLGGSSEMVVKTVGFLQVGKYDPLPPGNFATVPKARAKQLIATGQVVEAVHAAPEGSRLARYTESDFAWSPNAKPAPEVLLQVADIRHRFTWSQEQWETAIGLSFPPADRTVFIPTRGSWETTQVLQWSERPIEEWRARITSLNIR